MSLIAKTLIGALLGIALGSAMVYGIVEFSHWIVEQTHALH